MSTPSTTGPAPPSAAPAPTPDAADGAVVPPGGAGRGLLTIPNLLTIIRLMGTGVLVLLALAGDARTFAVLFLLLAFTDWVDGRLARWLNQRTDWGARLDSAADAILFAVLIFGSLRLKSEQFLANRAWIAAVILSFAATCAAGLWKFGRLPAYHTWLAKGSWHLVMVAMLFVFFDWSTWPLRIALLAVTLANLEALAMTWTLDRWHADVRSLRAARRLRDSREQ